MRFRWKIVKLELAEGVTASLSYTFCTAKTPPPRGMPNFGSVQAEAAHGRKLLPQPHLLPPIPPQRQLDDIDLGEACKRQLETDWTGFAGDQIDRRWLEVVQIRTTWPVFINSNSALPSSVNNVETCKRVSRLAGSCLSWSSRRNRQVSQPSLTCGLFRSCQLAAWHRL